MWIRVTREAVEGKATPSKNLSNTRTSINKKRKRHQSPEEIRYTVECDYNETKVLYYHNVNVIK